MQKTIERANLNDTAETALREMIVDGVLEAGVRLNEVHIAAQLGVSRTPLREALNRLVSEGAVEARPRLGYFVKPLTLEEFGELYDIRPLLEPEALRLAGAPDRARLDALDALNRRLTRARTAVERIARDDDWHRMLIGGCPNRVLLALIESMMLRTRRYELAWMRASRGAAVAADSHDTIIRALRGGRIAEACTALRDNLAAAKPAIAAWLSAREARTNKESA